MLVLSAIIIFVFILLLRAYMKLNHIECKSKKRLDGKTCVVTGGTTGMGLETARDLARRGARVIIACPFLQEGLDAKETIIKDTGNSNVIFKLLDLSSLQSTRDFAQDILQNEERLDILVNNAGVGNIPKKTEDGLLVTMQVNYYGHFLLTNILLPLLKKTGTPEEKGRIVNVSSIMYCTARYEYGKMNESDYRSHWQCYSDSKLCLLLFAVALTERLKESNVIVNSVDPGPVGTRNIFKWNFGKVGGLFFTYVYGFVFKDSWQGAQSTIFAAIDESMDDISGSLVRNCHIIKPFKFARDPKAAEQLWEESMKLVNYS